MHCYSVFNVVLIFMHLFQNKKKVIVGRTADYCLLKKELSL